VFCVAESRAVLVIALDIAGGQVIAVLTVTNPEKLPPRRPPDRLRPD
jgi:hypothetical protein